MTITLTREEAQQILDALEWAERRYSFAELELFNRPIETLRAKLSEPEPEPVAWFMENTFMDGTPSFIQVCETDPEFYTPLYRAPQPEPKDDGYCQACEGNHCTAKTGCVAISNPPQRKECQRCGEVNPAEIHTCTPQREWVGLTDEQIRRTDHHRVDGAYDYSFKQGAKWAEAYLKEKNAC